MTVPQGHLLSAIEETAKWSQAGERPEAAEASTAGGNEAAMAEFDQMVSGMVRR